MTLNNEEKMLCFMFFSFLYGSTLLEQTIAFFSPDWVIDNYHPPCEAVGLFSARNCSYYDLNYLDNGHYWCRDINCMISSYQCQWPTSETYIMDHCRKTCQRCSHGHYWCRDINCMISSYQCQWPTSETYIMDHCRKTCQRCSQSIAGQMFYPQLLSLLLNYVTGALLLGSLKICRNDFLLSTTAVFYGVLYPISGLIEASTALYVVIWYHSGFASRLALASGAQSIILYVLTRMYDCKYQKDAKKSGTIHSEIFCKKEMPTFKKWKIRNKWDHIKLDLDDIYTKAADETRIKS